MGSINVDLYNRTHFKKILLDIKNKTRKEGRSYRITFNRVSQNNVTNQEIRVQSDFQSNWV